MVHDIALTVTFKLHTIQYFKYNESYILKKNKI